VRLPLDLLMVFTANPEDYTARGKIITPLKDRIGSEIRTHYPSTRQHAMEITAQEAWLARGKDGRHIDVPIYVREVVEEIAFQARADRKIDRRSGVSQRLAITCLENVLSNAERRALTNGEPQVVARVTDVYAALPSITGKFEMEYEGELKGADNVARDLIRASVANVFAERFDGVDMRQVIEWFDLGGSLQSADTSPAKELLAHARGVQGLVELADHLQLGHRPPEPALASAVDFVLEGLYAQKKISRSEDRGYHGAEQPQRRPTARAPERDLDEGLPLPGGKKKYYN
jgi:magnesium chelatase subunit I